MAATHLSRLFRQRRIDLGLSVEDLAQRCRLKNKAKVSETIQKFESIKKFDKRRGEIPIEFLKRLAKVLEITDEEFSQCLETDRREWEKWASRPVEPYLIVRLMPAVYVCKSIPAELHSDRDAMERSASEFAKNHHFKVCLVLDRRTCVWFDRKGDIYEVTVDTFEESFQPYMNYGGVEVEFLLEETSNSDD